jgi:hypothetical protein
MLASIELGNSAKYRNVLTGATCSIVADAILKNRLLIRTDTGREWVDYCDFSAQWRRVK